MVPMPLPCIFTLIFSAENAKAHWEGRVWQEIVDGMEFPFDWSKDSTTMSPPTGMSRLAKMPLVEVFMRDVFAAALTPLAVAKERSSSRGRRRGRGKGKGKGRGTSKDGAEDNVEEAEDEDDNNLSSYRGWQGARIAVDTYRGRSKTMSN
jgi:hypothetical protein